MSRLNADPRLIEAVDLFNAGEFFACHDVLEEIWDETLSRDRSFYQGLIHAAVALHHFEEGNPGGARKMFGSARQYLGPFLPQQHGIATAKFLEELEHCFAELCAATAETIQGVSLDPGTVPRIRWFDDE